MHIHGEIHLQTSSHDKVQMLYETVELFKLADNGGNDDDFWITVRHPREDFR